MVESTKSRGEYLIGVEFRKQGSGKPFRSQCKDPLKRFKNHIGCYDTEIEAHLAWKDKKHKYALDLAGMEDESRVKEALKTRYL